MTYWLSEPIESIFRDAGMRPATMVENSADQNRIPQSIEYLIVGSGYGAAMAALALLEGADESGNRPTIWVFERGDEYVRDDFPKTFDDLPSYINFVSSDSASRRMANIQNRTGLWEIRAGEQVSVLSGSGLGGTSLVNANVASNPPEKLFESLPAPDLGGGSWQQRFDEVDKKIRELLGVKQLPYADTYPKYEALEKSVNLMEGVIDAAELSINFDGSGPHSVGAGECNRCGNCVIGCHSGAKQSLNMNAWPLAKQMGQDDIQLFTGVTARWLEKGDSAAADWVIGCESTRQADVRFTVNASVVILAAGTLGSVEILQRSANSHGLELSSENLGKNFSTNGDALVTSVGQNQRVNSTCDIPGKIPPDKSPGPTIIGKAEVRLGSPDDPDETFTLEDGAIPFPLIPLWQELIVLQNFLRRYTDCSPSAWHRNNKDRDFLAISPDLNDHSQLLLVMGNDRARGRITFEGDVALPNWTFPPDGQYDYFKTLDARLRSLEKKCLDGGHYHPNPLWKPLPHGFDEALEGAGMLDSSLLSVHPLGGCSMASTAEEGVVNARGQVFDRSQGSSVHDGLYVLDGAILPGAIGTNPFLTIAKLSYLLAFELARVQFQVELARGADFPLLIQNGTGNERPPPGAANAIPSDEELKVEAVFKERLVHYIDRSALLPWSVRQNLSVAEINELLSPTPPLPDSAQALVLDIEFDLTGDNDLDSWLEYPDRNLPARAVLSYDPRGSTLTVTTAHLKPIARLTGTVNLGLVDKPFWGCWFARFLFRIVPRFWRYRRSETRGPSISRILGILRVGRIHTDYRVMEYRFEADSSDGDARAADFRIQGRKTLAYDNRQINLWGSLLTLPSVIESWAASRTRTRKVGWELDAVDISKMSAPLQVFGSLNLLSVLTKAGGALAYFFRVALQTHFWSFGAPDYDEYLEKVQIDRPDENPSDMPAAWSRFEKPPERIKYRVGDIRYSREVEIEYHEVDGKQVSRLIRYQPAHAGADAAPPKALMLIHGLAHGSRIFWTDTISDADDEGNMTQFFLKHNYDVWIIDHRTSPNFVEELDPEDLWDLIATEDIRWAVGHVFRTINDLDPDATAIDWDEAKKVHVFSHCIGAGAASMAALAGSLNFPDSTGESMLASLVPHAVAPWLFTSMANRARSNLWALAKDQQWLPVVEPCPHRETPLIETILDRLATSSLSTDENAQWQYCKIRKDPRGPMFPRTIYTRYTIIWGRQWANENISHKTRNQFGGMIGAAPRDVLQQVYTSVIRGLLSDHDGNNSYVTKERLQANWTFPTLFIHGDRNTVFDIETSRKSAAMLTRHRREVEGGVNIFDELQPEDYCNNNVWIETLPGYGHMDVILGGDALHGNPVSGKPSVFPKLHRFFSAAESVNAGNNLSSTYLADIDSPEERAAFKKFRDARSHVGPIKRPLTGPIISHPEITIDENTGFPVLNLHIWVEAQDFTSIPVKGVVIDGELTSRMLLLQASAMSRQIGPMQVAQPIRPVLLVPRPPFVNPVVFLPPVFIPPEPYYGRADFNNPEVDEDTNPHPYTEVEKFFWLVEVDLEIRTPGIRRAVSIDIANGESGDLAAETQSNLLFSTATESDEESIRYLWVDYDTDSGGGPLTRPGSAVELRWEGLDWLNRIAFPDTLVASDPDLCFLAGSCLYPGFRIDFEQMSQIFDGMYAHVERDVPDLQQPEIYRRGVDHIMLIGDQIYADATAEIMDPVMAYEKYRDRYRRAWSNPPARRLFSHVPTYFAVDDHEYDNDYQGAFTEEGARDEFAYARNMAWQYQVHDGDSWNSPTPRLWQKFTSGCYPFFVFDTRLERTTGDRLNQVCLMEPEQLIAFDEWLRIEAQTTNVIFIASGSPFAPVTKAQLREPWLLDNGDTLLSYPMFIRTIIDRFAQRVPGKHICWLTGDPHLSCYAKLTLRNEFNSVNLTQICASGLYSPLSFTNVNRNACDWESGTETIDLAPGLSIDYEQFFLTDRRQHFIRVELDQATTANPMLKLSAHDASGDEILIPGASGPVTHVQIAI